MLARGPRMVITDLDGTLLDSRGTLAPNTRQALEDLGEAGIPRVVATGRSPHSFLRAVSDDLPIDFAILSSGVGIVDWPQRRTLFSTGLGRDAIAHVAELLLHMRLDFMVHHAFPENHAFWFWRATADNPDFDRRVALYREHAAPLREDLDGVGPGAQVVAIVRDDDSKRTLAEVRSRLADFSILRTTSPIDRASTWIEIFPAGVTKGSASAWLAGELGVSRTRVLAIGNDYNDLELLEWAGNPRVVANAPGDLRARFPVVPSNDDEGVVRAIHAWIEEEADGTVEEAGIRDRPPSSNG